MNVAKMLWAFSLFLVAWMTFKLYPVSQYSYETGFETELGELLITR